MGIINLFNNMLLASWPEGFWENSISQAYDFIGNYGLTIILFTVTLKLILIPLDFYQRKSTRENTQKQRRLQPQLEALNKKYANKKEVLNQKTMELYKKENYNIVGSCFTMLLQMVLTLVIFITLFGAMNNIAQFKITEQFTELQTTYTTIYEATVGDDEYKTSMAQGAVIAKYEEVKEGFLWINNIWRPDRNTNIIPTYEEYLSVLRASEEDAAVLRADYDLVMSALQEEHTGWNGYFILIIGAALITFVSQRIMQKFNNTRPQTTKNKDGEEVVMPNMKVLSFLLPLLMVYFTWGYNSAFALYIITNSAMTMLVSVFSYRIIARQEENKQVDNKPEYSR